MLPPVLNYSAKNSGADFTDFLHNQNHIKNPKNLSRMVIYGINS